MPRFLPEIPIPTPFGRISFPQPETPPIRLRPELDERRRQALGHSIGIDGTKAIALVPVVGDFIAESLGDLHRAEISRLLNPEETEALNKYNKVSPFVSLAMLRAFIKNDQVT